MANIFIFRRDIRLQDNLGLLSALNQPILPIFIFTPEQVHDNPYFSNNGFSFMLESLDYLDKELRKKDTKLHVFYQDNISALKQIKKKVKIESIVFCRDLTPYAINRDNAITKWCEDNDIECLMVEDYTIHPIDSLTKKDGSMYEVFTPYLRNALKKKLPTVNITQLKKNHFTKEKKFESLSHYIKKFSTIIKKSSKERFRGGREEGLRRLRSIGTQNNYEETRNMTWVPTTELSAYIKFGCISIREVANAIVKKFGKNHGLLSQLFWREYYATVAYTFPKVLQGKNYSDRFKNIKWRTSTRDFEAWCKGCTGYPIVDAGMRQLNSMGYQHNRLRLICSNFLNRILGIDWREGERYYAKMLTDYDPAINNGNWQWIASTGVDPKPYNQRLFNPWLQSKRYDKDAKYIKKWIPELKSIPANHLHDWEKHATKYDNIDYPEPCVDYKTARMRSLKQYKNSASYSVLY